MTLSEQTKSILKNLDNPEFMAMEEVKMKLQNKWATATVKKDTEFETIWAVAQREAKIQGVIEFLQILTNPEL
jgi:hypothetical protein